MTKKKIIEGNFKSKFHEDDAYRIKISSKAVSIIQDAESGTPIESYLTFEAIEELYNEIQKVKGN
jgi:hypothetical protein